MLGAPQGWARPVGQVRRVRGLAATEEGQASFDEGGVHANGVFEQLLSVEFYLRAEAHPRFDASDRDLHPDAGGIHIRGQADGVDAAAVYRLEPDGLPDPGRPGVEDPLGLLFPVLLAPGDGHVSTWVFGPHDHDVLACECMRHIGRERSVAAFVGRYLRTINPDRRAVVHSAEVEQETLVASGRVFEGASIPNDVVERRLSDAGELRLVAIGNGDLTFERRIVRAQGRDVRVLPTVGKPGVRIVESEAPLAVQVCPVLATQLRARVLGSWYGPIYHL